jgi:3-deoxy-D-manno-octulosonic-acid transferase
LVFFLILPVAFVRLWIRGKSQAAYRKRWAERIGRVDFAASDKPRLWFHTVSVGEFIATRPLIERYLATGSYRIFITTTTPTGSERVRASFGEQVDHCYLPYDIGIFLSRLIKAVKPCGLVSMETEIWPNLFHACNKNNIPIILGNARLSEKSARGYRRFGRFTQSTLNYLHTAVIQNKEDAQRFRELGLSESKITVSGNIKFDLYIDTATQSEAKILHAQITDNGKHPILIAASTHRGEDEQILAAYTQVKTRVPSLKLILVPRHPERFDEVGLLCEQSQFTVSRRSEQKLDACDILLGDTMGELLTLLGAADIAFIGGSLIENGGHNYIEPAAWSLPILSGPSYFNFAEVVALLKSEDAINIVRDADDLASKVVHLLEHPDIANAQGARAKAVADLNRGATEQLIQAIDRALA